MKEKIKINFKEEKKETSKEELTSKQEKTREVIENLIPEQDRKDTSKETLAPEQDRKDSSGDALPVREGEKKDIVADEPEKKNGQEAEEELRKKTEDSERRLISEKNFLSLLKITEEKIIKEEYENHLYFIEEFFDEILNNPEKYYNLDKKYAEELLRPRIEGVSVFDIPLNQFEKILINKKIFPELPDLFWLTLINTGIDLGDVIILYPERFNLVLNDPEFIETLMSGDGAWFFDRYYKWLGPLDDPKIVKTMFEHRVTVEIMINNPDLFKIKFDVDFFKNTLLNGHFELAQELLEKHKDKIALSHKELVKIINTYTFLLPNPLFIKSIVPNLMAIFNIKPEELREEIRDILGFKKDETD